MSRKKKLPDFRYVDAIDVMERLTKPRIEVYKPSKVARMIKAGAMKADLHGYVACAKCKHVGRGETDSPGLWENGSYCYCEMCDAWTLAMPVFATFVIDTSGERKTYPMLRDSP